MSKEKANSVPTTLPQKSESEVVQVKEGKGGVKRAYNLPRTPKEVWRKLRVRFEEGSYTSLKGLSTEFGVSHDSLRGKICREKWNEKQIALQHKVTQHVENKVLKEVDMAASYLSSSFKRAQKYEQMLEASVSQMATNEKGVPLVDPDALDTLSRSEARIHEWAKSCLRIIPVSQIDHTSNGESLGQSFVSAISKLREAKDTPRLQGEDLSKVLEAEVE